VPIAADPATSAVDIPWYVSDNARISGLIGWSPQRPPKQIVGDITAWVRANESSLSGLIT
jgi:CDP-paratose 2-epimerase